MNEVLYVLYDRECVLCTGTVDKLRAMHMPRTELRYIPLQELESSSPPYVPGRSALRIEDLYAKLHVVDADGRAFAGADGIVRIMRTMPSLRWLAWCYAIPGARWAADALYRYIAKRRYDWFGKTEEGCANGACALPARPHSSDGRKEQE
jgi:predicted DCC family thiol-disulfide oxidoreductase YuxK